MRRCVEKGELFVRVFLHDIRIDGSETRCQLRWRVSCQGVEYLDLRLGVLLVVNSRVGIILRVPHRTLHGEAGRDISHH